MSKLLQVPLVDGDAKGYYAEVESMAGDDWPVPPKHYLVESDREDGTTWYVQYHAYPSPLDEGALWVYVMCAEVEKGQEDEH